jgi:hypothetical protein
VTIKTSDKNEMNLFLSVDLNGDDPTGMHLGLLVVRKLLRNPLLGLLVVRKLLRNPLLGLPVVWNPLGNPLLGETVDNFNV